MKSLRTGGIFIGALLVLSACKRSTSAVVKDDAAPSGACAAANDSVAEADLRLAD